MNRKKAASSQSDRIRLCRCDCVCIIAETLITISAHSPFELRFLIIIQTRQFECRLRKSSDSDTRYLIHISICINMLNY